MDSASLPMFGFGSFVTASNENMPKFGFGSIVHPSFKGQPSCAISTAAPAVPFANQSGFVAKPCRCRNGTQVIF